MSPWFFLDNRDFTVFFSSDLLFIILFSARNFFFCDENICYLIMSMKPSSLDSPFCESLRGFLRDDCIIWDKFNYYLKWFIIHNSILCKEVWVMKACMSSDVYETLTWVKLNYANKDMTKQSWITRSPAHFYTCQICITLAWSQIFLQRARRCLFWNAPCLFWRSVVGWLEKRRCGVGEAPLPGWWCHMHHHIYLYLVL